MLKLKAMIMAAGVGSRLMPLTMYVPKPMIPVGNRPLMDNIIHWLTRHDFRSLISNLYYHPHSISDYFGNGDPWGVELQYSFEEELWGTAGGVKKCEWFLNKTFAVVSGDALTDIDLTRLLAAHKENGALATIALKPVDEVEQFGIVVTDDRGRIQKFQEKPRAEQALSHLANTGIYIFEPEIFKYIPPRQFYDFGKQLFPHLVKIAAPFYGVPVSEYWCDIGSLNMYRQAHQDVVTRAVDARIHGKLQTMENGAQVLLGNNVTIGRDVLWQGINVIGDDCVIADRVQVSNSVIWENTCIERGACLDHTILGSACRIGAGTNTSAGAVVGSGCVLPANIRIPVNSKVFDSTGQDLKVEEG